MIGKLLFSHSVVSSSLRPHGLQHSRLPCPSPSAADCSHSSPLSWWCHPIISSSVAPFSSCLQSFPASWSFPVSIGTSSSASVLPMNIQGWFPFRMDWLDLLAVKSLLQHHSSKASIIWRSAFFYGQTLTSIHNYWKNRSFDYRDREVES